MIELKDLPADERMRRIQQENEARNNAESLARLKVEREKLWAKICPPAFRVFDFDKAKRVDAAKAEKIMNWQYGPVGMFIVGETGHCKTRLAWQAIKNIIMAGHTIKIMDGIEFATEAGRAMMNPEKAGGWLHAVTTPHVLFIDDFAKRMTPATAQALFAVVDRRMSWERPVIFTSNYTGEQITSMIADAELSEPILRRLRESCEVFAL